MITLDPGHQAKIDARATSFCVCTKITRVDGVIDAWTDHDRPLSIDADGLGAVTYLPARSFNRSAVSASGSLEVDSLTLEAVLAADEMDDGFAEDEIIGRQYDDAHVIVFVADWSDATVVRRLRKGTLGLVSRRDFGVSVELRGLTQALATNVCSLTSTRCRSDFGATGKGTASGCRFPLAPPAWQASHAYAAEAGGAPVHVVPVSPNGLQYRCTTPGTSGGGEPAWPMAIGDTVTDGTVVWTAMGAATRTATVSDVSSRRRFLVTGLTGPLTAAKGGSKDGGWFALGTVTFTSGTNAGITQQIAAFTDGGGGVGDVILMEQMPFDFEIGDAVTLRLGCDQTAGVCTDNMGNRRNFRGEDHLPGEDLLFRIIRDPKAKKQGGK